MAKGRPEEAQVLSGGGSASQDELILAQRERIEKEIRGSTKLVGDLEDLSILVEEFELDLVFRDKVESLASKYSNIRRVRPDGNCFFRSLAFAWFERIYGDPDAVEAFLKVVEPTKARMIKLGFPEFTVEDFYDSFMDQVRCLAAPPAGETSAAAVNLESTFNDQGASDYIVVFLRLLTSMHLREDAEFYQNFLENDYASVDDFCSHQVEPMYNESDHVHVTAITKETGIRVRIMYLDRGTNKEASPHDFPESDNRGDVDVHLLYRPGHYDILYPKE